ncbi:hypothetical protein [uncultured Tenacibaculum sp.]|uniref:hypothetical protein n=1 Tax=uncultured Tenacibaculum sp. TaxID=174713 RepID=UPI002632E293|nr:hypothetical protein [uncultured Tenacibaculum sp.]
MELHFKAMKWCWNNGVKITPFPIISDGSILKIIVSKNGNETLGEQSYTSKEVFIKINELYLSIYEKNNKLYETITNN